MTQRSSSLFEILGRDAFGRAGVLRTGHGKIRTPTVLPVIDPFKQKVTPADIVEIGADAVITNAYLLYREPEARREVLRLGVHDYLGVDCPVATDSGGYQIYRGRQLGVSPDEIHAFQAEIGSDLAVVLDVPPREDMSEREARTCIDVSVSRSVHLMESPPQGPLWYGAVHLTPHTRLRRREAKLISRLPFDVLALGSCVGSLVDYRFEAHLDRVVDTAKRLPPNLPRHVFGVGHPVFLAMSAAFGGDLFDSAMYALAAEDGRYLTSGGTIRVPGLRELGCSCPVCLGSGPDVFAGKAGVDKLSRHNLYATFEELRRVRQAMSESSLWELAQARCRSHPRLLGALQLAWRRHRRFLESVDPLDKRSALFYSGPESRLRPEVTRACRFARERLPPSAGFNHPLYGKVSYHVALCYPFGQTVMPEGLESRIVREDFDLDPIDVAKSAVDFQFGPGCGAALEPFEVARSRKTGRIKELRREAELLGVFRSRDFAFLLSLQGGRDLKACLEFPRLRVVVSDEASPFVSDGKSAFAKFITNCDPDMLPGQEALIVDEDDELLATGTARMNAKEMLSFQVGVAATVRHAARAYSSEEFP